VLHGDLVHFVISLWQNFIICIEMLVAAIAHYFVFSHKPFVDRAAAQVPCVTSCLRMLDIRDIYGDVLMLSKQFLPDLKKRYLSDEDVLVLLNNSEVHWIIAHLSF